MKIFFCLKKHQKIIIVGFFYNSNLKLIINEQLFPVLFYISNAFIICVSLQRNYKKLYVFKCNFVFNDTNSQQKMNDASTPNANAPPTRQRKKSLSSATNSSSISNNNFQILVDNSIDDEPTTASITEANSREDLINSNEQSPTDYPCKFAPEIIY